MLPEDARRSFQDGFAADVLEWQTELFKQSKRLADDERKLAQKFTKTAEKEVGASLAARSTS